MFSIGYPKFTDSYKDFKHIAYVLRIQKLYIINIGVYTTCGDGKVELLKSVNVFNRDQRNVSVLVLKNDGVEHCALIKTTETLIDRPNKNFIKC